MFDRFYRRRDATVTGNGLGLAIAKEIAVRHGASIVLGSSEALGGLSARVLFHTAKAAESLIRCQSIAAVPSVCEKVMVAQ